MKKKIAKRWIRRNRKRILLTGKTKNDIEQLAKIAKVLNFKNDENPQ